jgi:hypothetical protein
MKYNSRQEREFSRLHNIRASSRPTKPVEWIPEALSEGVKAQEDAGTGAAICTTVVVA